MSKKTRKKSSKAGLSQGGPRSRGEIDEIATNENPPGQGAQVRQERNREHQKKAGNATRKHRRRLPQKS